MTSKPVVRELSDNARVVLERRYLAKDDTGRLTETPEEVLRRVAANIAQAEAVYEGGTRVGRAGSAAKSRASIGSARTGSRDTSGEGRTRQGSRTGRSASTA